MLYWLFKWTVFAPGIRLLYRPWVEGEENIPHSGPGILVSNHVSTGETLLLPSMIRRRLTFVAKAELFQRPGLAGRFLGWFLTRVGQLPIERSGGRASATTMDGAVNVLKRGELVAIYPEGTRSPDGRLHKGKTGVARLVLAAGVPVIPVAMINTKWVRSRFFGIPWMRRPGIRIGKPLDFSAYAAGRNDRDVLRWVTDEIMNAVMQLSGQRYVDAYAANVKAARKEGRQIDARELPRPGAGNAVPPVPAVSDQKLTG